MKSKLLPAVRRPRLGDVRKRRLRRWRAADLQLGRLHEPRTGQEVRREVQRQGHGDRLRFERHRARQGARRRPWLRHRRSVRQLRSDLDRARACCWRPGPTRWRTSRTSIRDGSTCRSIPAASYTVPWQWGTTGILLNTKYSKGDPNTSAIFLDPPDELKGKINVVPEMADVMNLTISYVGGEPCTGDKEILKKVRDMLIERQAALDVDGLRQPGEIREGRHRRRRQLERLDASAPA